MAVKRIVKLDRKTKILAVDERQLDPNGGRKFARRESSSSI